MGLSNLSAGLTALVAANQQLVADAQKLLAGQSAGPGPGQVIVNQADIDALTATVNAQTAIDVAEDQAVNPPTTPPAGS